MIEEVWREKGRCVNFSLDYCIIEKVLEWLERDDTDLERVAGYSLCLATVTYFLARLFWALF